MWRILQTVVIGLWSLVKGGKRGNGWNCMADQPGLFLLSDQQQVGLFDLP
jgi:hypothetical protein